MEVWYAPLDLDQEPSRETLSILSETERQRTAAMAPVPRRQFVASRAMLRRLLACYLSPEASTLEFANGTNGKPSLAPAGQRQDIHFNLSHTGDRALFAFGRTPVGVDLERIRALRDPDAVAERFFSVQENGMLAALPATTRQRAFFACWTRKEAYVKALGTGIAGSFLDFSVVVDPSSEPAILGADGTPAPNWTLHHLEPEEGLVGAVATNQPNCRLSCWRVFRTGKDGLTNPVPR